MGTKAINWRAAAVNQAAATLSRLNEVLTEAGTLPLLDSQARIVAQALGQCSAHSIQWAAQLARQGEDITPAADPETWETPQEKRGPICGACPKPLGESLFVFRGKPVCEHCAQRLLQNQQ